MTAEKSNKTFDYIIVGAGSAGCVLADRLSENPDTKVLLLEAGGKNKSILVQMPAGAFKLNSKKGPYNWGFRTEPQTYLNGRQIWWPRGKGWGGSSSVNGMVYIRGHASDYDQWAQMGLRGWSYAEVLPYFKRSESFADGPNEYHGGDGRLYVERASAAHPIYDAFVKSGVDAGFGFTADFNGYRQEGFGRTQLTLHDGKRWSSATAFLRPIANKRRNLTTVVNAQVTRVVVERGHAVGVEYLEGQNRETTTAWSDGEIILSGGSIQSPHVLQLSGIGDPDVLQAAKVTVVHDLPGVGKNLQDHVAIMPAWRVTGIPTAYSYGGTAFRRLLTGINYALFNRGPGRQNFIEAGAFLKSKPDLMRPNIQLHCPLTIPPEDGKPPANEDGFCVSICVLRPESRGEISIRSADPFADPSINPNYLSARSDLDVLREGFKIVRGILDQAPIKAVRGSEFSPGANTTSDKDIEGWIRATGKSIYHPVGTCRMGQDSTAVVDDTLSVRGISGLRVVDASVMPTIIGGNTNAPTIMIAEKAADMLRGKAPLPRLDVPVYGTG